MSDDSYIYESPDGGKTVTRRKFGDTVKETVVTTEIDDESTGSKFKTIKKQLMIAELRSHFNKDHESEHIISEIADLVDKLEQDINSTS